MEQRSQINILIKSAKFHVLHPLFHKIQCGMQYKLVHVRIVIFCETMVSVSVSISVDTVVSVLVSQTVTTEE